MEMIDLVPFIALSIIKHGREENIVYSHQQEYYGNGVVLVPVEILPWEEFIARTTGI